MTTKNVLAKVWIYTHIDTHSNKQWFEGECDLIVIKTNCPELKGEPVVFSGESRAGVLSQIIDELKARDISGVLRVVN